jgi:hypothetical protein
MNQFALMSLCFIGIVVVMVSCSAFGLWWIGPEK